MKKVLDEKMEKFTENHWKTGARLIKEQMKDIDWNLTVSVTISKMIMII